MTVNHHARRAIKAAALTTTALALSALVAGCSAPGKAATPAADPNQLYLTAAREAGAGTVIIPDLNDEKLLGPAAPSASSTTTTYRRSQTSTPPRQCVRTSATTSRLSPNSPGIRTDSRRSGSSPPAQSSPRPPPTSVPSTRPTPSVNSPAWPT